MDDDGAISPEDETLTRLGRLMARLDPVPDHVTAAAQAALTWRTVDEELAALLHDSADTAAPALTRAHETARVITFGSGDVHLELEVSGDARGRVLMGQFVPPAPLRIEIRHPAGTTVVDADDGGSFTARDIPSGPVSLRFARPDESGARNVVTPWLRL